MECRVGMCFASNVQPANRGADSGFACHRSDVRVRWVSVADGLYGVQNLGQSVAPAHLPAATATHLYRVTGIGLRGQSRTVLESIYARYQGAEEAAPHRFRRVMWRQLQ